MSHIQEEKEVKVLEKEIVPFIKKATSIEINDEKDMRKAAEIRTQIKTYASTVKNKKETVTKPMNAALKAVRALFSPLEDRIEEGLNVLNRAMITYQTEQQRIADEEAAKISARIGAGKGKLKVETAVDQIKAIDVPEGNIITSSGGTSFITVPCFEVVDLSKLPFDFILPNEVKIRAAMKSGTKLDGVRYWTEQRPRDIK